MINLKQTNNWHLISGRSHIILDSKTGRFRRHRFKSNITGKVIDWVSMVYDSEGRLTQINFYGVSRLMFYRIAYDSNGELLSYRDYKGDRWEAHWDMPFLFKSQLNYMHTCEVTFREHFNNKLGLFRSTSYHNLIPRKLTPPKMVNIHKLAVFR